MRRPRRVVVAALSAIVAAAAIVIGWRVSRPEPIVLAQADRRALEPRVSDARADRWRPYGGAPGDGGAREEVRVDTLTALERRGDWRGLGDAYLLAGEPDRAAAALARAPDSADVAGDRAAVALQKHDAAAALAEATRALALAPGHAQAAWNRALALRDLGLSRSAAVAFDAVARGGERGWSDEALKRAMALRAEWQTRERARQAAEVAGRAPALADEERAAVLALKQGDAATAERRAQAALDHARAAGADPRGVVRRLLVVLADAARAQGKSALADAYVDEARTLVPGGD